MFRKIRAIVLVLRPAQAYKLGIVWLPALFHGHGSLGTSAGSLAWSSLAWWFASGIVYVLNDLKDAPTDRLRADRAHRPIASDALTPREALALVGFLLLGLGTVLALRPGRLAILIGLYGLINFAYTLGLKDSLGTRQAIIATGFWLRLQSGALPLAPVPLTPWAGLFTLGLAYYLNCLKGLAGFDQDHHRGYRFAMGLGAGLAGSLALASLVAICLKRGLEGTMHFPELPPLFCLLGLHRVAFLTMSSQGEHEQSRLFFRDPAILGGMLGFLFLFLMNS